jgi:hypothetical protein
MNGNTKLSLDTVSGVTVTSLGTNKITLNSGTGNVVIQGNALELDVLTPQPSSTNPKYFVPIYINGVEWYLAISNVP